MRRMEAEEEGLEKLEEADLAELLAAAKEAEAKEKDCKLCHTRPSFKKRQPRLFRTLRIDEEEDDSARKGQHYDTEQFWHKEDPPDIIDLGHAGWTLLHSTAAYYPEKPSEEKQSETQNFLASFAKAYPCNHCATDFQRYIKRNPPTLTSRKEFSLWTCRAHNEVNIRLGKPEFPCERADDRWRIPDDDEEDKPEHE